MSTRTRNFVRSFAAAAVITASCGLLSVGVASAANPSDVPQLNSGDTLGVDGCYFLQDDEGVVIAQQNPFCLGGIGEYPQGKPRGY